MKISAAALLFLAFEAPAAYGFSSYLSSLSGTETYSSVSYARKPQAPTTNNGDYLSALSTGQSVLKFSAPELGSQQQPGASSSAGYSRVSSSAPATTVDYLSSFSKSSSSAPKKASYSGFNSKPQAPATINGGYLGNLNNGATMAPPSQPYTSYSSPAPAAPVRTSAPPATTSSSYSSSTSAASPADYMASLGGGKSYQPAKKASYAGFNTKPRAPATTGYLGNLHGAATISSASYSTPSYSTSSYSAPASSYAPAASTAAAAPADYMKSLGGGSATTMKKSSYAPFSGSKPRAPAPTGYLGALANRTTPPAVSSYSRSSPEPTLSSSSSAAPADYMSSLAGGSSGMPKKASFAPFAGSKPKAVASTGYLGALTSSAPAASSYSLSSSRPAASSSAAAPADYMSSLAGSSGPMKKASYAPFAGNKPRAVAPSGYLGALTSAAPASSYSSSSSQAASTSAAPASYMSSLTGSTGPMKKASYAPFAGTKPKAVAPTGYLGALTSAAPATSYSAPSSQAASTSGAGPASYMSSLAGSSGPMKKPTYSGFNPKPKVVAPSGYLGALSSGVRIESTVSTSSASSVAPSSMNYMSSIGGGAASMKKASYSPFAGSKPKAVASTGYLGNLAGAAPAPTSYPSVSASSSSSSFSPVKKSSYSPFSGAKPKAVATTGYLGNLIGAAPAAPNSYPSAPAASIAPSPSSYAPVKKSSYSPFAGSKPKAVASTGYLGNLAGAAPAPTSYPSAPAQTFSTVAATASAPISSYSPFGSKPIAPVNPMGGWRP